MAQGLHCSIAIATVIVTILRNGLVVAAKQTPFIEHYTPVPIPRDYSPILDEEFSTWIDEKGKGWGMKGVAVAVVRKVNGGGEWITETKGYGVADRWGNAVDEETLFSIGSNSKLFTAFAIGMLVENSSTPLTWHSKVKDIVPNHVWGLQDKIAENHANIVDILSHRTGLPAHDLSYSRGDRLETTLSKLRYLRPSTEFRELYQYNNQMYMLASHIVSRLSGTKFVDYVTHNIIRPLGLSSTTYNVTQAEESGKLADGFIDTGPDPKRGEGRRKARFRPVPFYNRKGGREINDGPGGVISNAKDLVTWLQALLLSGQSPTTGDLVIPAAVVDRVSQGVTIALPVARSPELSPTVYGMGQSRYTYQGHELIEHSGGTIGHYSIITRAPHDGLGIAILTNWDDGVRFMTAIKYRLLEKALGLPAVDWDERLHKLHQDLESRQKTSLPSKDAPGEESHHLHELAGLYFNPAYGTLALCVYPPPPLHTPRPECATPFPKEIHSLLNSSEPVLLAAWPKVWSSHLMLRHDKGDRFNGRAVYAYPAPFPEHYSEDDDDTHPFAVFSWVVPQWTVQFISLRGSTGHTRIDGMAWRGMWNNTLASSEGKGGADIWFDRIV